MGTSFIIKMTVVFLCLLLSGCERSSPAPVTNAWLDPQSQSADYIVHPGDTLYSIAWQFGLDYAALAAANHLKSPYSISPGQHLKMTTVARGMKKSFPPPLMILTSSWQWPVKGKIIQKYSPIAFMGNSGINIVALTGTPIHAALAGEVVYSGNGIHGYNHLIIIKHNRHYLSAYAYNQQLLVHTGQQVNTGQPIATMGHDDSGKIMLHFEIRYDGHPVDPLLFLR